MTVIKQFNPDTTAWETVVVGEKGDTGDPGAVGAQGVPGPTGPNGSGLFFWGAWGGASDTPLPDPPPPFSETVTQSGGLYLISGTPPDLAPDRPDATPAQPGDGMVYDPVLEEWINVGPTRGPTGFGVGVAAGGTTGQVLAKISDIDYATGWADGGSGGGDGDTGIVISDTPPEDTDVLWADTNEESDISGDTVRVFTYTDEDDARPNDTVVFWTPDPASLDNPVNAMPGDAVLRTTEAPVQGLNGITAQWHGTTTEFAALSTFVVGAIYFVYEP